MASSGEKQEEGACGGTKQEESVVAGGSKCGESPAEPRLDNVFDVASIKPMSWEDWGPTFEPPAGVDTTRYAPKRRPLSHEKGKDAVGVGYIELDAGCAFCPYHYHIGRDEAVFVLEGTALLRQGAAAEPIPVRAGDFILWPSGKDYAHQMVASSPMKYLAMSVQKASELCLYPDSEKIAVSAPGVPTAWYTTASSVPMFSGERPPATAASKTAAAARAEAAEPAAPASAGPPVTLFTDPEPVRAGRDGRPHNVVHADAAFSFGFEAADAGLPEAERVCGSENTFQVQMTRLTDSTGVSNCMLGVNIFTVPAGKTAGVKHYHAAAEEAVYILEGEATMRQGMGAEEVTVTVKAGTFIRWPPGRRFAHQLLNASADRPLKYLCLGERVDPDICFHVRSDKVCVWTNGIGPFFFPSGTNVPYFTGEKPPMQLPAAAAAGAAAEDGASATDEAAAAAEDTSS